MQHQLDQMAKEAYMLRDFPFFEQNKGQLDWHRLQQWMASWYHTAVDESELIVDDTFVQQFREHLNLVWMDDEGMLSEAVQLKLESWLDSERELQNDAFDQMYG